MYVIYNHQPITINQLPTIYNNRSFLYGDSLFETMICQDGKIKFLKDHLLRLKKGMAVLHLFFQKSKEEEFIIEDVNQLILLNNYESIVRFRLQVWRKPGGYYTPHSSDVDYLITAEPYQPKPLVINQVGFFKDLFLHPSPYSRFKTGNSLPYILASIDKVKRNLDAILLLDRKKNIAEESSSNIFWERESVFYTPSLNTGCIAGIMRKQVISLLKQEKYLIEKGKFPASELLSAHSAFLCNVTGIYPIQRIGTSSFNIAPSYMNKLYTLCV